MNIFFLAFVPSLLLRWYHWTLALVGAILYGFPSRKLVVVGVTGTNGKSTTVEMISRIFTEAGFRVASTSSIRFQMGDTEERNTYKMTMPGRLFLQKFLRQAVTRGCTHAVIEVTSEGILQHRHRFINFHTAVFTNLSPEHIERHGSFENYRAAKGKLFQAAKRVHIINGDDKESSYFLQFPSKEKWIYSFKNPTYQTENLNEASHAKHTILYADEVRVFQDGMKLSLRGTEIRLKLLGEFNAYNALAAICAGLSEGISLETCKRALEKIEGVPGRMERVIKEPFQVFVDYAFTPAALEKVYQTLQSQFFHLSDQSSQKHQSSKLICVLGAAGGGRDKWKRPVLGKIAATYCDYVIVTNEDPYDEDPAEIMRQVAQGAKSISALPRKNQLSPAIFEILDRREAIKKALRFARAGDTVIITGKGSEDSIALKGGKKIPWDDREVVREEFSKIEDVGASLVRKANLDRA